MSAKNKTVCPTPRIFGVIDAAIVKRGRPVDTMLPQRVGEKLAIGTCTGMRRAQAASGTQAPNFREVASIDPLRLPPPRWTCQAIRAGHPPAHNMNTLTAYSDRGYKEILESPPIRVLAAG